MNTLVLTLLIAGAPAPVFKSESEALSLPVPAGWRFNPNVYKPSPSVPVPGKRCVNSIWFDFIPGANVELTRQLIDTESLDVTTALRRWDERTQSEVTLAGHPVSRLTMPSMPDRSIYWLATAGGTLVIQEMALATSGAVLTRSSAASGGPRIEECTASQPDAAAKLIELFFAPEVQARAAELSKTVPPPAPRVLEPVPATLDECFAALEKELKKEELEALKNSTERELASYHLGLGMGLRNRWGLWGGSPLAKYFQALGVFHPDDMSGVILRTFWRHLNGKPVELEREVAEQVHSQALRSPPEPEACPNNKPPRPLFQLLGRAPEKVVSIFVCDAQRAYRAWELSTGWYEPDAALKKRIEHLRRTNPGLVSGPLEE